MAKVTLAAMDWLVAVAAVVVPAPKVRTPRAQANRAAVVMVCQARSLALRSTTPVAVVGDRRTQRPLWQVLVWAALAVAAMVAWELAVTQTTTPVAVVVAAVISAQVWAMMAGAALAVRVLSSCATLEKTPLLQVVRSQQVQVQRLDTKFMNSLRQAHLI